MADLNHLLQTGGAYSWIYMPSAVLLGALHGLEPGHSKTMMAAFIVAIHGTIRQAMLLGLSAALSHTAIVWVIAALGLYYGARLNTAAIEPYLQLVAAMAVLTIAVWILWRTRRSARRHTAAARHDAEHDHDHEHHQEDDHDHDHDHDDEHAREHAAGLQRTLGNGPVTTGRIMLFGLTGGLVPCPASITVLMVCLQLKQMALGAVLVLCFGIGLALTLVLSGMLAALGVQHASRRFGGLERYAARAPYFSGLLMFSVGLYLLTQAVRGLDHPLIG